MHLVSLSDMESKVVFATSGLIFLVFITTLFSFLRLIASVCSKVCSELTPAAGNDRMALAKGNISYRRLLCFTSRPLFFFAMVSSEIII